MQTIDAIIIASAKAFDVSVQDVQSKCRRREFVRPRQVAMALARREGYQFKAIAHHFDRDHTTVIHAIRRFPKHLAERGYEVSKVLRAIHPEPVIFKSVRSK